MKRIKAIILGFILMLFISGCKNPNLQEGFKITGNVKDLKSAKLLVVKFVNGGIEMDSITVRNNKFEYSGKVKEPYFIQLLIKEGKSTKGKLTEFMIENSKIVIKGNSPEYDSVKVSGSQSDKILKEYLAEDEKLNARWNTLKVSYDRYVELKDTVNRKLTAKELNKILKVDRVGLLKKYVHKHSNSTLGALLPQFCTIENALTKEDYQEIYNSFSESIKKTDYAQEVLNKAKF